MRVEAAYEAGIEAFVEQGTCAFTTGSALHAAWLRGFEDAGRDLSSVWCDASQAGLPPEAEALMQRMSPAERRAMIAWLSSHVDPAAD